jgi:hypothetical protein
VRARPELWADTKTHGMLPIPGALAQP